VNRVKYWSIVVVLILIMQNAYGQKSDYIATDSSLTSGIKLIKGTPIENAQFIQLKKKNETIQYYPDQLSEYGFKNGTVYESKTISMAGQTKTVFLERLESGKINLYFYSAKGVNTYFIERDTTVLVEINKDDDFRKTISEHTSDFSWIVEQVQLVNYKPKSLSKLISLYNNGHYKHLPFPRFGITTGYSRTSLPSTRFQNQLNDISFTPSSVLAFGFFVDLPIEMSNISFNVGLNFSKSGFSASSSSVQAGIDAVVNITSANIPFLLRYTLPTLVWRPFVNAGGIYSYHLRNYNRVYESIINQSTITINEMSREPIISEGMLGYSFGLGLQRNLNYKKIISVELRLNQLYGNKKALNKSMLEAFISFSF
jgi:hypothetical protein